MTIQPGDALPESTLMLMGPNGPEPSPASGLFGKGRTVLFAVPGPFTPTCSAQHLPGYLEHEGAIRACGIDQIACTAVSDIFVMSAWARDNEVGDRITMAADGNGDFARAMGLELDGTAFGIGFRTQRYSMHIEDGQVRQLFVERPGEFKVSSAEHMLASLRGSGS